MSWRDLFPLTAEINAADHLELGGCDVTELAAEFGTPLYVYDAHTLDALARRARAAFESRWDDVTVLYATKAYFAPFLARMVRELGLGLDVTSEAEIVIARGAEFDPETLYVHGNNKTAEEIRAALAFGIRHFVVDHLAEPEALSAASSQASRSRLPLKLLICLSPNIDAHTHRYMTTGVADSKFGLGIDNRMAEQAARAIQQLSNLELVGLHFHIGSQVFDTKALREALDAVLDVAADWRRRFGFNLRELNIGGGWGVAYNEQQRSLDVESFAEHTTSALRRGLAARELEPRVKLIVEPGRGLIARAGVALYRVGAVKTIPGVRNYVMVDGGMGDNVRPALYSAQYQAYRADSMSAPALAEYAVAGRYCEQGDVLIESTPLPEPHAGDLLAVPVSGAYQLPMASNYNLIPRPAVVLVKDGTAQLVRRREKIEDVLACDLEL